MDLLPWMRQCDMLPPAGGTVLCAVSGGRDSVCLLHYLVSLSRRESFSVAVAHMDHGQRSTARRDAAFVEELCQRLEVPCYVERVDVPGFAEIHGLGIEEAGRKLRYEFFRRVAEQIGAQRIATAHHADDQAETVLLQLLRGTGPEGLCGIPPVRGKIIRPLLQTSRRQIEEYLAAHGLPHVEDETNEDRRMTRNLLRLELLPQLERINPALRENICRTAGILREENEYLNQLAAGYLPEEGTELAGPVLQKIPQALRPRVLRLLADRLPVGKKDFGAVHYRAILELTESSREGMLSLPGGVVAEWKQSRLRLILRQDALPEELPLEAGENLWGPWKIRLSRDLNSETDTVHLADGEITVRGIRPSDRLCLEEGRGSRSVKRLCVDRGIGPQERDRLPAFCLNGQLAAVYGLGTDRAFLPAGEDAVWSVQIETKEEVGGKTI